MHTLRVHEQGQGRQSVRNFIRTHYKIASLAAIVLLAGTIIIPYANAATTNRSQSSQPAGDAPASLIDDSDKETKVPQDAGNSNQTQVTVNGQSVDVPANGNYHQVTEDANGRTEVKVESSQHSSGDNSSNSNSSTVNINVDNRTQSTSSSD